MVKLASPPLTEMDPVRGCGLPFAAAVYPKVEGFAVPPPKLRVIHGALLTADFRQLAGVPFAVNVPFPPEAGIVALAALKVTDEQV
jgi:hypothetical protein